MRMYAACLASYNNGHLHGEWFDLEDFEDASDLQAAIEAKVLRTSPYPNVTVECPKCSGCGSVRGMPRADEGPGVHEALECPMCQGGGQVPSAEEWAVHDWEGEGLSGFGEYPNLDKLMEHVRLVSEHGDAWLAYVATVGEHYATEEGFTDDYIGEAESARAFFEDRLEETGALNSMPEDLRMYFDWDAYVRDQELNGGYSFVELNGTTYVFSN